MKKIIRKLIVLLFMSTTAFSNDYVVIANKSMQELSKGQIKAVFLKKLTLVSELNMVPINMGATNSIRMSFEKDVLKTSFIRLKSYWTQQHYLGHRPPITMQSQESVKAFVKKVEGAIGYIESKNIDEDMKILYKWSD